MNDIQRAGNGELNIIHDKRQISLNHFFVNALREYCVFEMCGFWVL